MKKIFFGLIALNMLSICVFAQNYKYIDSLKSVIKNTPKPDTIAVNLYRIIASNYTYSRPDSALYYNSIARKIAEGLHYQYGTFILKEMEALCYAIQRKDSLALKLALECLKEAENHSENADYLKRAYMFLGTVSFHIKDFESAIKYCRKFFSLRTNSTADSTTFLVNYYRIMGETFDEMNQLDSAEFYISKDFQYHLKKAIPDDFSYYLMGNVYAKRNQWSLALQFYREAKSHVGNYKYGARKKDQMDIEIGFARVFVKLKQIDSAIVHAKEAYQVSKDISIPREKLESLTLLAELYKQKGNIDSVFVYLTNLSVLKDTLLSEEKIRAIQNLSFTEESRQQKLEEQKEKEDAERGHNIQLAITAIVILSAIILFLLLSRSILVSHKVVEFLSVVALLVVFEFINLLIHPFLESVTHHSPVLMLIALVAIATLIVPLHHRLEHWTTKILVEKNKAIRLKQAKKTIEELEQPKA